MGTMHYFAIQLPLLPEKVYTFDTIAFYHLIVLEIVESYLLQQKGL